MPPFWLAVHLPRLSLEAFSTTLASAQQGRPVALIAQHHISAVNHAAAACGIQPGTKRATALALAADLVLGQADAERDAQALLAVAHAALAFTPNVTLQGQAIRAHVALPSGSNPLRGRAGAGRTGGHPAGEDTVLLEISASLRLFGGARPLLEQLRVALAALNHQLVIASAPTALGAALLARAAPSPVRHARSLEQLHTLLDTLPVWLIGPAREHWEALQGMGLQTLGDLRALPRAGLARRFGDALLTELDRARGTTPDPREWLTLPEHFTSRVELHHRADTTEQLLHGAQVLLARLVTWVRARCARVAAFTLHMHHERRHQSQAPRATELAVALAEPSNDPAHLQLLLRERLAHCTLPAPTLELELRCRQLRHSPTPNGELFPSRQGEAEGFTRLIERLRARLGDEQVLWLHAHPDHRPEQATRRLPQPHKPPGPSSQPRPPPPASSLHRPVWLLPEPEPLTEQASRPCLCGAPLVMLAGPERVETGWWDNHSAARDYFIAQTRTGALVWVYRCRLPSASEVSSWYLHGRFG